MLDNGLIFSLMISTLTTFSMYIYKKYYSPPLQDNSILINELSFLFIISFIISFLCKYCNNSDIINQPVSIINSKIKTNGQCPF